MRPGPWNEQIRRIVETYQNGEVQWFTRAPSTGNPVVGSGSPGAETVIATTPARIQHLREPRSVSTSYDWTTYRRFRFQIPYSDISDPIQKGVFGRITDGGDDPKLVGLVVQVQSAVNSSWAAIRTVEGVIEGNG